jgi:hypothetical protein
MRSPPRERQATSEFSKNDKAVPHKPLMLTSTYQSDCISQSIRSDHRQLRRFE